MYLAIPICVCIEERWRVRKDGPTRPLYQVALCQVV